MRASAWEVDEGVWGLVCSARVVMCCRRNGTGTKAVRVGSVRKQKWHVRHDLVHADAAIMFEEMRPRRTERTRRRGGSGRARFAASAR
jgi:hypothetical protein